jgi:hypothetical protein
LKKEMSKKPQHLDDFLRDKLNELPHAPVAGFERVEERMVAKSHRGIVLMLLIPLIATGIYWIGTLTERDLFVPVAPQDQPITNTPGEANQVDLPAVESEVEPQNAQLPEIPIQVFPNEATDNPAATTDGTLAVRAGEASEKRIYEPQLTTLSARAPPDVVSTNNYSNTLGHRVVSSTLVSGVLADGESTLFAEGTNLRNQEQSAAAVNPEPVLPIYSAQTPWEVTLNFYPNYTFREFKINPNYGDMINPRYEEIIRNSERGGFGFNVGLAVRYHLGSDVFLASGLGYIENKVNGAYNFKILEPIYAESHNQARVGKTLDETQYTSTLVDQGIVQTFRYLQVPLHISYQPWATERLRLLVEGGMSYIRFISASGATIDHQTLGVRDVADLDYVKNMGSFDFKVGFAYYVSNQIAVGLEPSFLYFTQSIFKDDHPTYVIPWSVGVNFNVRMRLY